MQNGFFFISLFWKLCLPSELRHPGGMLPVLLAQPAVVAAPSVLQPNVLFDARCPSDHDYARSLCTSHTAFCNVTITWPTANKC